MSEQNQENTVVDQNGKEIKTKKMNFFKKVWYSITKFEKYVEMSLEGTNRAIKYLVQIVSIFVLIIAIVGTYNANKSLNGFIQNIENNVPNFKYAEGKITLDSTEENKVYTLQDNNLNFGKLIIDLETEDENVIAEYEENIKNDDETNNSGFIILKDKVVQVVQLTEGVEGESTFSLAYDEVITGLFGSSDIELSKADLVQYLDENGRTSTLIVNFCSYFIAYSIIYIISGLTYALILALIGYISSKLIKINLKFSQFLSMSIYALTLSTILNMIYFVVNYFAGITLKYFDIAYIAIAYIYLVTVMFLLKTDFLKKEEVKEEKKEEKEDNNEQ